MPYKDYEKHKANARENYYRNREKRLAQVSAYYYANWAGKQEYRRQWIAAHPEEYRESRRKGHERWFAAPENRLKRIAYQKVKYALRTGKLVKPNGCEECGSNYFVHAHHDNGYEDALNVMWLCKLCHERKHHEFNTKDLESA